MKNKTINLAGKVKAYDDIFKSTSPESQGSGDIVMVELEKLLPFPDHPFKLYTGKKLDELVESIKELGVLNAILIRKISEQYGMYQILSGHNRANAAKLAGLKQIKAEIVDVDDDTAILFVVDSNFKQRETLLPSERAFAFKMQLEAMKRQGKRVDLMEDDNRNIKSRDMIGRQQGLSGIQIFKYIRLTELLPELIEMIDARNMSIKAGVDLSYLSNESQKLLYEYLIKNKVSHLDNEKASVIRNTDNDNCLSEEKLQETMEKIPESKRKSINLKRTELAKYFPSSTSNEEIIQKIILLLESSKL